VSISPRVEQISGVDSSKYPRYKLHWKAAGDEQIENRYGLERMGGETRSFQIGRRFLLLDSSRKW
jgi:hypothetical protein